MAKESAADRQDFRKQVTRAAIGFFAALFCVVLSLYTAFYTDIESRLLDQRFIQRGPISMHPDVKTIDIDAISLAEEGRWQDWERDKHSIILPMLKSMGARMIGFDIYFVEPSTRTLAYTHLAESDATTREEIEQLFPDLDEGLRASIEATGNVILGQTVNDNPPLDPERIRQAVEHMASDYLVLPDGFETNIARHSNIETPLPEFVAAARGVGLAMTEADADGSVRHYPVVKIYDGKAFPALAVTMVCEYIGVKFKDAVIHPGSHLELPEGTMPDGTPVQINIPIDDTGKMMINWAGDWLEDDFQHIPHLAVIDYFEARFNEPINREIKRIFQEHPDTYTDDNVDVLIAELEKAGFSLEEHGPIIEEIYGILSNAKLLEDDYIAEDVELAEEDMPEEIWALYQTLLINHAVYDAMQENPDITRDELVESMGRENWRDIGPIYAKLQEIMGDEALAPENFPLYFLDVEIGGRFMSDDDFKDGVFFYGLTAAGTHDLNPMPYDDRYPMLGLHANAFNTILTQQFLSRLSPLQNTLIMIGFGLLMGLFVGRFKPLPGAGISAVLFAGYLVSAQLAFDKMGLWIDILGPMATMVIGYMSVTAYNFFTEEKEKKMIRGIFSRYVTKSVVDELIKNPDMVKLGGERKELTVFFSDVAGFTSVSEALSPEDLVQLLNEYLTAMTNIVLKHDGMIDKYEGDLIMAVFGTPVALPNHALTACLVSLEMQVELAKLRAGWKEEGRPELKARIGLNTGQMIAGNMGAADRLDYTVMGDAVNLGSRLEGANKAYGTNILISEMTLEHCKDDIQYRFLDSLVVKGKNLPVKVYEVLGAPQNGNHVAPDKQKCVDMFTQGVDYYLNQEWDRGLDLFHQALEVCPDDGPSKVYRDRTEQFKLQPPGADWDGVYVMTTK